MACPRTAKNTKVKWTSQAWNRIVHVGSYVTTIRHWDKFWSEIGPNVACVTAASPRKKTEERRLCLTVDNRVRGHVTFPGMCGKWYDWLSHYHANSMSLIGYNFRGFSTGGMRWENLNHFDKSVVWVRAYFAQILSLTTATKISSTEGRVPHSKFQLKYWRWTTEYPLTLPTFAGVASHYWRKEER